MKKYIVLNVSLASKLIITGVLVSLFYFFMNQKVVALSADNSLEYLFLFSYGHVDLQGVQDLIPVFFWIAPQLILLYFLGNYISVHLEQNAVYIFTRTHQRSTWLLAKVFTLCLYVLIYYFIQFITLWIVASSFGFQMNDPQGGIPLILEEFTLLVLLNILILLMVNILSLKISSLLAYTIVTGGNIASLFFSYFLNEYQVGVGLIKWFPFTQGILSWHSQIPSSLTRHLPNLFYLQDFSILFSTLYLVISSAILLVIGVKMLEKMDLI